MLVTEIPRLWYFPNENTFVQQICITPYQEAFFESLRGCRMMLDILPHGFHVSQELWLRSGIKLEEKTIRNLDNSFKICSTITDIYFTQKSSRAFLQHENHNCWSLSEKYLMNVNDYIPSLRWNGNLTSHTRLTQRKCVMSIKSWEYRVFRYRRHSLHCLRQHTFSFVMFLQIYRIAANLKAASTRIATSLKDETTFYFVCKSRKLCVCWKSCSGPWSSTRPRTVCHV